MNSKQTNVRTLAYGGMMAALVFVATYFLKLPVPVTQGYVHLGDGFILLGAALLGKPAIAAAAIGSMLADVLGGYTLYVIPTFLIKGLVALIAVWAFARKRPLWLTVLALIVSELAMVAGYFVVEWLVLGYGWAAAAGALAPNLMQGLSGVIIALVLLPLSKRIKL